MTVWEYLGREKGEFQIGDKVWHTNGRSFMIMRNSKSNNFITIEEAKKLFEKGELTNIADDNDFIYSFNEVIE